MVKVEIDVAKFLRRNDKGKVRCLLAAMRTINLQKDFEANDKDMARLNATLLHDMVRYNPDLKSYMYYDGARWRKDKEGMHIKKLTKLISDAFNIYIQELKDDEKEETDDENNTYNPYAAIANKTNKMGYRNTLIKDAQCESPIYNEELDADDYILNVKNGVIDLNNGKIRFKPHNPNMLMSKVARVYYDNKAKCPNWDKFIDEIMLGDQDEIHYIQKIMGLCLTGDIENEKAFILYGPTTRNGKSTLCETMIYMLGDYALTLKPESLADRSKDGRQANSDIAKLEGCRLLNVSEPRRNMVLDIALLKTLTGGDTITARNLFENERQFQPKFKIIINTNHLPLIIDSTAFMSNRLQVIPFNKHFDEKSQNKQLKKILRDGKELSGILNWALKGLRMYRQEGLNPPSAVVEATDAYRKDSDKLDRFISECMVKDKHNSKASEVFIVYQEWCFDNGFGIEKKKDFLGDLRFKGILLPNGTVAGRTEHNVLRGYVLRER